MTDATSNARRFPILLTAFIAVCVAILCALGTWQVQRLTWKEGLIDLENRKGKRAGAFCTSFSDEGLVAIFCNSESGLSRNALRSM